MTFYTMECKPPPVCENCGCDIFEEDGHHIEAFETTGKIICSECWDGYCMDELDPPTTPEDK